MLGNGANGANGVRANGVSAIAAFRRPHVRRRILALVDQGASSLSNVVVVVLVARAFDSPEPFGAFGLAMVIYVWVASGLRAVVGEPLLSLYSHQGSGTRRRLVADLYGSTLSCGVLCSLVLWGVSTWVGGLSGSALASLAVVLPLMLLQDTLRFMFIVDRPGAALAIDVVWLATVAVVVPMAPADAGVAWFVVVWGLAGGAGAALGIVLGGGWPGWPHPWRWLVAHRTTGLPFLGDFLTARSAAQLTFVALGAIAGLGALGAVMAMITYFGVLNSLQNGLYLVVVPEGVEARRDPARLRRLMAGVAGGQAALAVVWALLGTAVPERWGRELFSGTWPEMENLMLPMGLALVASAVLSGGFLGVRSLGDPGRSFTARLHSTVGELFCPLLGAVLGGAMGFVVGLAAGRAVAAVIWWRSFDRGLADFVAGERRGLAQDVATSPEPLVETDIAQGGVVVP